MFRLNPDPNFGTTGSGSETLENSLAGRNHVICYTATIAKKNTE